MSFNLEGAFNQAVALQSKEMTFYQVSTDAEVTMEMAPGNYFRNQTILEESVSKGREFVISKKVFDATTLTGAPERGDRVISSDLGNFSIKEVREMVVMGTIVGYRVRGD